MKKYCLDTNCFIDLFTPESHQYESMCKIIKANKDDLVKLAVSRHTLYEMPKQTHVKGLSNVLQFLKSIEVLNHFPMGNWGEQISSWEQTSGTWNDVRENQQKQQEIEELAKAGNDIRDRGAYIDSLMNNVSAFVTSDTQFAGPGPANRLQNRFGLEVLTPEALALQLVY